MELQLLTRRFISRAAPQAACLLASLLGIALVALIACQTPSIAYASDDMGKSMGDIVLPDAMTPDDMDKLYDNGNEGVALASPAIFASNNSTYLYYLSRSKQGMLNVYDTTTSKQIDALKVYDGEPYGLGMTVSPLNPSRLTILAQTGNGGSYDKLQYSSVDLEHHKTTRYADIDLIGDETGAATSADGTTLYIARYDNQAERTTINVLDAQNGKQLSSIDLSSLSTPINLITPLHDGKRMLANKGLGFLTIDLDTGDVLHYMQTQDDSGFLNSTTISPDGKTLYATNPNKSNSIYAFNLDTGEATRTYPAGPVTFGARATPDGNSLILPTARNSGFLYEPLDSIQLLDLKSGDMHTILSNPPESSETESLRSTGITTNANCTHLLLRVVDTVTIWTTGLKDTSAAAKTAPADNQTSYIPLIPIIAAAVIIVLVAVIIIALTIRKRNAQHHAPAAMGSTVPNPSAPVAANPMVTPAIPPVMPSAPPMPVVPQPASVAQPAIPVPLPQSESKPVSSPAPVQPAYCTHCGNPIMPGARFCPQCGTPIAP